MNRRDLFKRAMGLLAVVPCLKWLAPKPRWPVIDLSHVDTGNGESYSPCTIHFLGPDGTPYTILNGIVHQASPSDCDPVGYDFYKRKRV